MDAEYSGDVPAYAEIRAASIRERGSQIVMEVVLDDAIPDRMEDDATAMTVEVRFERGGEETFVYAEAEADGWEAYARGPRSSRPKPELILAASTITFTLARTSAPRAPFAWVASMSWTRGTETDTYFAFDTAPNHGRARHP